MRIVLFTHPDFGMHQSMPRYSAMLLKGMQERGHQVTVWKPKARVSLLPFNGFIKKWLGYVDQYLIFPFEVRLRLMKCAENTLFVFTDQALGPWVPLVKHRPHVIHCHDFLAQNSALGNIQENKVSFTGRWYQKHICRGYNAGKNFISVSKETQKHLHQFLINPPKTSEVIYNSVNPIFKPIAVKAARSFLTKKTGYLLENGFILHVGGNQWYKNRVGVIEIYEAWRSTSNSELPLLLIGEKPSDKIFELYSKSPYKYQIHFLSEITDDVLRFAYAAATVLLFPSLAEGFGWPVAEAMASGCLVVTTDVSPITEVGANAAYYISKRPVDQLDIERWTFKAACTLDFVITLSESERKKAVEKSLINAKRFNGGQILNRVEDIYKSVIDSELGLPVSEVEELNVESYRKVIGRASINKC